MILSAINGTILVGIGAFAAGCGSLLSGYAALKTACRQNKKEEDEKPNIPPSD